MNIALIGYGKMGKEIEQVAPSKKIAIKKIFTEQNNPNGLGLTKESLRDVDVCIEFTGPTFVMDNIVAVAECGKNIVVGTTGWYDQLESVKTLVKKKKIGLLYSANFSLGMNIFQHILSSATYLFESFDCYDVAISECHHKEKADSPSGTALALGQIILQHVSRKKEMLQETARAKIRTEQLQITSTRVGHVPGTHRVVFDSEADSIELIHAARNRQGFALGALIAAEWLKGKNGLFTMKDVFASL